MRQRLMIVLAIFGAGFVMLDALETGGPIDATGPYSLLFAASPTEAIGHLALLTLGSVLIGSLVGAFGNPLGGVFVVSMGLLFPALEGGGIDLWIRSVGSEQAYWQLIAELALWMVWVGSVVWGCQIMGAKFRRMLPQAWRTDTELSMGIIESLPVEKTTHPSPEGVLATGESGNRQDRQKPDASLPYGVQVILSGVIAAAIGLLLTPALVRSPDLQQVTCGIGLAYLIAGLISHQLFPECHPIGVILAPLLGGAFWYAMIALGTPDGLGGGGGGEGILQVFYQNKLVRGGLVMPVFYASAGVAGGVVGVGWSQVLVVSKEITERWMAQEAAASVDSES